ncbi:hypothetical protein FACS1894142_5990 [Spirochaetia bacterium]|nr:hypothetical protein FACS1894142_5990 [Spirochaetia bacterium]
MNQSLSQALAGCTITGKMQTLFARDRIDNAAKLAAAMNPMTGAMAALNAMNPCRALDLRSPAERIFSHILEERAARGRALAAMGYHAIRELVPELSGNISHVQTGVLHEQ